MSKWHLDRRTFLRGTGTAMALPMLDAMLTGATWAAAGSAKPPKRMGFFFVPNGAHMPDWTPTAEGSNFELPRILKPLAPFQKELLVFSGLGQDNANSKGDGGGDHARCAASFLTGAHPHKTSGKDIRVGVSVDQIAAQQVGELTRLPSLELGCEVGKDVGNCDSGYSCAYSNNISWRTESTPQSKEVNPRAVFDRLFGGGKPGESEAARLKRQEYRKSVLDFVHEDATRLRTRLGTADRHKLDEYLDSVRSIEQRIERTPGDGPDEQVPLERPDGIPRDYAEHIRLMMDLIAVAFQTDSTRITSMMIAKAGSNRSYPFIGVSGAHHSLSHHGNKKEKQEDIAKINKFHVEQFAYLLKRLKATPEGEGTLLDNVMLVYGSAIADGNRHAHHDLPIVMAGGGGGTINTGRHIRYESKTPLNNLFLSMLDRMDVKIDQMGDSTGRLDKLA